MTYLKEIKLSGLTIPGNIILAPMAGYTDAAFRSVCISRGAFMGFTEMVSAEALARGNRKTLNLLKRADNEKLLGVQIFASNADSAARAVEAISAYEPSLLDLNCGCSVTKVIKTGCGAALLKEPLKIKEIVRAMCRASSAPVSVKLRSGWDTNSINYLETAAMAVAGGASMITLHPRTRSQAFTVKIDLSHLKALKELIPLPIIGSGDLYLPENALRMVRETGCDGVMFARGAVGNPFIFSRTRKLFSGGKADPPPEPVERLKTALEQLLLASRLKGEGAACKEMRKHFSAYTRGVPGAARLRAEIVRAKQISDYENLVNNFLDPG